MYELLPTTPMNGRSKRTIVSKSQPVRLKAPSPNRQTTSRSGRASFAMAAKLARPDREVVCLFGDGAFSLTGWDFETMVRFDLPFIGVVGNNSYMNQIRYGQIQKYGEERGDVGNKLGDVKYDLFAKILGGYGEEVREPKDIRPALERARESGKPSLINVWIDQNVFAPGTMNQTMYK